ncbi:MAG: hypothetical protein H7318_12330 [Oligoflexus sp.]|nr:hypothetical protein [Oligoflexus sp.]
MFDIFLLNFDSLGQATILSGVLANALVMIIAVSIEVIVFAKHRTLRIA